MGRFYELWFSGGKFDNTLFLLLVPVLAVVKYLTANTTISKVKITDANNRFDILEIFGILQKILSLLRFKLNRIQTAFFTELIYLPRLENY